MLGANSEQVSVSDSCFSARGKPSDVGCVDVSNLSVSGQTSIEQCSNESKNNWKN